MRVFAINKGEVSTSSTRCAKLSQYALKIRRNTSWYSTTINIILGLTTASQTSANPTRAIRTPATSTTAIPTPANSTPAATPAHRMTHLPLSQDFLESFTSFITSDVDFILEIIVGSPKNKKVSKAEPSSTTATQYRAGWEQK